MNEEPEDDVAEAPESELDDDHADQQTTGLEVEEPEEVDYEEVLLE